MYDVIVYSGTVLPALGPFKKISLSGYSTLSMILAGSASKKLVAGKAKYCPTCFSSRPRDHTLSFSVIVGLFDKEERWRIFTSLE